MSSLASNTGAANKANARGLRPANPSPFDRLDGIRDRGLDPSHPVPMNEDEQCRFDLAREFANQKALISYAEGKGLIPMGRHARICQTATTALAGPV
jgi:hypothetical protein